MEKVIEYTTLGTAFGSGFLFGIVVFIIIGYMIVKSDKI
jgi:hypothetical protein